MVHSLVLKHNQKENKITEYLFSYRNLVMEINLDDYEFYIKPGATDLRKRAISLARVVQDEMKLSPFEKAIFIFCNKSCRRITAILWNNNGWIEISKVLECRGTYCWPKDYEVAKQVKIEEIMSMLRGANIWRKLPVFKPELFG